MGISFRVFEVAIGCMGIKHIPNEVLAKVPPALRWPWVSLMLPYEPCVPTPSERDGIELGERLPLPFPLSAERRYAGLNLRFPFTPPHLCFMARRVTRQLQMRFTAHAVQPRILLAHVLGNPLAGEPSTVLSSI